MMTKTHWLGLAVSLITATALAGCGGGVHELGESPDAAAGSTGASGGAGGVAIDAAGGGSGGSSSGGAGAGGAQGGKIASGGAGAGGSSSSARLCCNSLACPGGYTLIGVVSGEAQSTSGLTCPAGATCERFTTSCGCNTVLCALRFDGGVVDATGGQGGSAGTSGTGGAGGVSGRTCPVLPSCNWCNGKEIVNGNGCVTGWTCANGVNPCSTQPCTDSSSCGTGSTCRDHLCWPGTGGTGGSGGSGGTSGSTCAPPTDCNWCRGETLKDANGCFSGYRCANGADPCKVTPCSDSTPCAAGATCSNNLCWPNDGGAGGSDASTGLCGGKTCGAGEACCGPTECGRCVNALSGQYCPATCTAAACGPSGASCKTGEVCLDLVYQTTTTRTATASCQPNPCGSDPLSCTCAKSLCGSSNLSCALADAATSAVVCSTK